MSSSKMPIKWHEENLKNLKLCLIKYKEELESAVYKVERLESDIEILEKQLSRAKAESKESFDPEKYNKSK